MVKMSERSIGSQVIGALELLRDGALPVAIGALISWLGLTSIMGALFILSQDSEVGVVFLIASGLVLTILGYGVYVFGLIKWRNAGKTVFESLGRRFEWGVKGASYMWKGLLLQLSGLPLMFSGMVFLASDNDVLAGLFILVSIILIVSGLIVFVAGSALFGVFLARLENISDNEVYGGQGLAVAGVLLAAGSLLLLLQLVAALLIRSLVKEALLASKGSGEM